MFSAGNGQERGLFRMATGIKLSALPDRCVELRGKNNGWLQESGEKQAGQRRELRRDLGPDQLSVVEEGAGSWHAGWGGGGMRTNRSGQRRDGRLVGPFVESHCFRHVLG